jgi:hypothetical protein
MHSQAQRLLTRGAMQQHKMVGTLLLVGAVVAVACSDDDDSATTSVSASSTTSTTNANSSSGAEVGSGGNAAQGGAGGDATGGMGGSGGGTMGASQACQTCVGQVYNGDPTCSAAIVACDADTACNAWKNCSEACFTGNDTEACYAGCEQTYPHQSALSDPLLACTCDSCEALCPVVCMQ